MTIIEKIIDWVNTVNHIRQTGKSLHDMDPGGVIKHYTKSVPGVYVIGKTAQTIGKHAPQMFNQATKAGKLGQAVTQKAAGGIQKAAAWWLTPLKKPVVKAEAAIAKKIITPGGIKSAATGAGLTVAAIVAEHAVSRWLYQGKVMSTVDRVKSLTNKEYAIKRLKETNPTQYGLLGQVAFQTANPWDSLWKLLIRIRHGISRSDIRTDVETKNDIRKEGFKK